MPVGVVINPVAGGGRGARALGAVVSGVHRLGRTPRVHVTGGPGEAIAVAERFARDGCTPILAVGGDGTTNEVANGLLRAGTGTPLGIVPVGRGTDLVRTLGGPTDVAASVARGLAPETRRIDAGQATLADGSSRWFVNAAGVGIDAEVAARMDTSRLRGSLLPYLVAVVATARRARPVGLRVDIDGTPAWSGDAWTVVVANGRYFGGGMRIVPAADPGDGRFGVVAIGGTSRGELLRNLPRVYRGTHVGHPKFWQSDGISVLVSPTDASTGAVRVQLDGEVAGAAPVRFAIHPAALTVAR